MFQLHMSSKQAMAQAIPIAVASVAANAASQAANVASVAANAVSDIMLNQSPL
jgi:hypothetical protein